MGFITSQMYSIHFQSIRQEYVKISLLQQYFTTENTYKVIKYKKVGEIQGNVINGSISLNVNSDVRRTCSLDIHISDSSFFVGKDRKIWMDKLFKVEVGIKDLITDEIVYFNKGIYVINSPQLTYNSTTKSLHIEGLDMMCLLNGRLGGSLTSIVSIPANTPLKDAILSTINQIGRISLNDQYIETNGYVLPYEIKKESTSTIYELLKEIQALYMDYEMFFNEDGRFIYQKIKNRYYSDVNSINNDAISYNFISEKDVSCDYNISYDFENVKNKIVVLGKLKTDGSQPKFILENTDINSPFNINTNIGIKVLPINDEKIFDNTQAEMRANYEKFIHSDMCETVTITCLPLYFLDGNQIIEFNNDDINLHDRCLIDEISMQLGNDKKMSIKTHLIRKTI